MLTSFASGPSATLRPTGFIRYIGAAFLTVWLVGWAIGEALALGFLIMLIRSVVGSAAGMSWPVPGGEWIAGGAAGFVFLFLIVWLSLWTFGGFAAIHEVLRSVAGEDRISAEPARIEVVRRAGLFRRVRTFDRSLIRRVRIRRHDKAVVMDTASSTEVITKYGTPDEREAMTEWLRRQLSLSDDGARVDVAAAPRGWRMAVDSDTTRLSRMDPQTRLTGPLIAWVIVALTGLIWFGSTKTESAFSSAVALVLTLLLASWAAWLTWSSREWLVQYGELTSHRRFGAWAWERSFKSARLEVVERTDSDNDDHYELKVIGEQGKRTIASEMNDEAGIVDLGRWLSARTGFPLTLPA